MDSDAKPVVWKNQVKVTQSKEVEESKVADEVTSKFNKVFQVTKAGSSSCSLAAAHPATKDAAAESNGSICDQVTENSTAVAYYWENLPEVALWEIFKYLPTSTLLSCCSLINKQWNTQVRSFVRDNRECTVNLGFDKGDLPDYHEGNLWESLRGLDQLLQGMTIIPFNSLSIVVTEIKAERNEEADVVDALTNLTTRFPLKYLSIYERAEEIIFGRIDLPRIISISAPAASTVLELVQHNSSTLKKLEIRSTPDNVGLFKNWKLPQKFDELQKLYIGAHSSVSAECAKLVIFRAPKLREIYHNCLFMIRDDVIPENMYGTLKRLAFGADDLALVETCANKLNQLHLRELLVDQVDGGLQKKLASQRDGDASKLRFIRILERVLTLNEVALCNLEMRYEDELIFRQLQFPALSAVKTLTLRRHNITFESLAHMLSINFPASFPNLHQVYIQEENSDLQYFHRGDGVPDTADIIVAPNASQTTLELTIDAYESILTLDLVTLRKLFPNVIKMSIDGGGYLPAMKHIVDLWPNLQSLRIGIMPDGENINKKRLGQLGALIFGLHPREFKFLRSQDKTFLQRVEIPPSRPCVATLKDLQHFEVQYCESLNRGTVRKFHELLKLLFTGRRSGLKFKMQPDSYLFTSSNWSSFRDDYEDFP